MPFLLCCLAKGMPFLAAICTICRLHADEALSSTWLTQMQLPRHGSHRLLPSTQGLQRQVNFGWEKALNCQKTAGRRLQVIEKTPDKSPETDALFGKKDYGPWKQMLSSGKDGPPANLVSAYRPMDLPPLTACWKCSVALKTDAVQLVILQEARGTTRS